MGIRALETLFVLDAVQAIYISSCEELATRATGPGATFPNISHMDHQALTH